jgi:hypothetical protein
MAGSIGQHIVQSPDLHAVFPDLRMQSKIWSPQQFTVKRTSLATDPSLTAFGLHSSQLGARYDLIILDDVLDYDNTRTENTRKSTIDWVMSVLMGRLDVGGRVIMIGNAWHPEDLLHTLEKQANWASFRFPILDLHGRSTWPDRFPLDLIEAKKVEFGPREFARQFMCQARSDLESRFRQDWFDAAIVAGREIPIVTEWPSVPTNCMTVTSLDLGVKRHAGAGLTVLSTSAFYEDGKATLLDVESGRWPMSGIIAKAKAKHHAFKSTIVVEDNGAQDFLVQQMRDDAPHIPIRNHTTGKNKHHPVYGVEGLAPEFARGDWTIPSLLPNGQQGIGPEVAHLLQDMLYYDPGAHMPDRLSAFWIGRFYARERLRQSVETVEFNPWYR